MIVIAIIGILAGLATYGVGRYVAHSKSAEALSNIGGIARAIHATAARETMAADMLAADDSSADFGGGAWAVPGLCDTAQNVPKKLKLIQGKKYQPNPGAGQDYETGNQTTGWRCLRFAISSPQLYQYHYKTGAPPISIPQPRNGRPKGVKQKQAWSAAAQGDLDGDGQTSWFVLLGYIQDDRQIIQATTVYEEDSEE